LNGLRWIPKSTATQKSFGIKKRCSNDKGENRRQALSVT
jgi:hypothetical protein